VFRNIFIIGCVHIKELKSRCACVSIGQVLSSRLVFIRNENVSVERGLVLSLDFVLACVEALLVEGAHVRLQIEQESIRVSLLLLVAIGVVAANARVHSVDLLVFAQDSLEISKIRLDSTQYCEASEFLNEFLKPSFLG
jgi:hypothetical protein